ncbi:hypothetical protein EBS57_09305 [bacterium]|nr:hypothetical protein [bacterium]
MAVAEQMPTEETQEKLADRVAVEEVVELPQVIMVDSLEPELLVKDLQAGMDTLGDKIIQEAVVVALVVKVLFLQLPLVVRAASVMYR